MVVSCCAYGCNNCFGEQQGLRFSRLPLVSRARRKERLREAVSATTQNTGEYVATILYQVSLQQAIASARIQLCAVAIKSFLH